MLDSGRIPATFLRLSSGLPTPEVARTSSAATSAQDDAARAAAGRLGIFSPAGILCSAAGPAWTRGELESPQGARRTANGYAAAVYTPEQQARLGVDEAGLPPVRQPVRGAVVHLSTRRLPPEQRAGSIDTRPRRDSSGGEPGPPVRV